MKPKVAFICVHNSCRSQMAEALGKVFTRNIFDSYSGGTEVKPNINEDAVKAIKDLYHIDMNESQHSKLISHIPKVDIVIKMGCNVVCPFLPSKHEEDWGLDDPTGKSYEEFINTAKIIEEKVKDLGKRIENNEIPLG
ncbi:low molecular weight phosphatase family protein [Clostridium hydrogeniformans]|uniref:arsenate reductase/protein-tyrosine-phosphatase family protein n=1 Tax=Clostridium hydrogeniformans TaxID=349933 RepID=UPI0004871087|nr:low molecular weight phosphatase family protein [Clostridium hydrogeniformans]